MAAYAVGVGIAATVSSVTVASVVVGAVATGVGAYAAARHFSESRSKSTSTSISIAQNKGKPKESTTIYRYGGTNPGNLTPKAKDLKDGRGLSFSTVPEPGCSMTTIEALNATGQVYAVQDGPIHVSVYPVGGTMTDWVSAGSGSVWTQAVKSVVVKWDGVS